MKRSVLLRAFSACVVVCVAAIGCVGYVPVACGGGEVRCTQARRWNFENDCTDARCGFRVVEGEAPVESAFAPGEHVLALGPGAMVEDSVSFPVPSRWEGIALFARCQAGTSLRLEQQVFVWNQDGSGSSADRSIVQREIAHPSERWEIVDVRFPRRAVEEFTQHVALRIAPEGPGRCAIDQVEYGTLDDRRR